MKQVFRGISAPYLRKPQAVTLVYYKKYRYEQDHKNTFIRANQKLQNVELAFKLHRTLLQMKS